MGRETFDVSGYSFPTGVMGGLKTLFTRKLIAGDSIDLNMRGLFRLAPLKRHLNMDAQIDVCVFYVKDRQIYGQDFIDFIKDGVDNAVTLPSITLPSPVGITYMSCLGMLHKPGQAYPRWAIEPYNRIWNRYYLIPSVTPEIPDSDDYSPLETTAPTGHTSANSPLPISSSIIQARHGYPIARLKNSYNTGIVSNLTPADREVAIPVSGTADLDIIDLEKVKARYRTEVEREYFNIRYSDVMKGTWGSGVNVDADERPTMLYRATSSMSGFDVNGQGDANLGEFSGKSMANHGFDMPRFYVPEHGSLWVTASVRFPAIMYNEYNPLSQIPNPTYVELAGDYDVVSAQGEENMTSTDWFDNSSGFSIGNVPYGNWYRGGHSFVDHNLLTLDNFPFIRNLNMADHIDVAYERLGEYDAIFKSSSQANWQAQCAFKCIAHRRYPSGRRTLFAGTR